MKKLLLLIGLCLFFYSKSIQAYETKCRLWNIGPLDVALYENQVNGTIKRVKNSGGDVLFFTSKDRQSGRDECVRINEEIQVKKESIIMF